MNGRCFMGYDNILKILFLRCSRERLLIRSFLISFTLSLIFIFICFICFSYTEYYKQNIVLPRNKCFSKYLRSKENDTKENKYRISKYKRVMKNDPLLCHFLHSDGGVRVPSLNPLNLLICKRKVS